MAPWVRLLGLLVAVVAAALFLKVLPPVLVLALMVGGIVYANHVLTVKPKRERSKTTAQLLGLRVVPEAQAGLSAFPFALLERPEARTLEVMAGPWRGTEVRLFDLETRPSVPVAETQSVRRFSCVLAPLPFETPHLIVEPESFLTPPEDRPDLPISVLASERIAAACDVRCQDPAFASTFLDGSLGAWLLAQQDGVAFETRGPAVLLYQPWVPAKDRDLLLESLLGFLDAASTREE